MSGNSPTEQKLKWQTEDPMIRSKEIFAWRFRWHKTEDGSIHGTFEIPARPSLRVRLYWWLLKKIIGNRTVIVNAHVAGIRIPPGARCALIAGNHIFKPEST